MSAVKMSDEAYVEFKEILASNNIESDVIRLYLAGMGWGGPVFNLVLDEQKDTDTVTEIKDLKFLVEKDLVDQFGGFTLRSGSENGKGGFSIDPNIQQSSGGCGGSCSSCG